MHRKDILQALGNYITNDVEEGRMLEETIHFIKTNPDCFERALLAGHVTGSAWIVNADKTHVLMMHHQKLDKWFQPGGHCDGEPNVQYVAQKEATEETGLAVQALQDWIFDVDAHIIPARKEVPEHLHYDIRYLFMAEMQDAELAANPEAKAVRWIPLEDVHLYNNSPSILRMVQKIIGS